MGPTSCLRGRRKGAESQLGGGRRGVKQQGGGSKVRLKLSLPLPQPSYNCRPLDPPTHTQLSLPGPSVLTQEFCCLTHLPSQLRTSEEPIMKPFLSFTVLAVLLYFLAEGPGPAQASSSLAEGFDQFQHKLKELSDTVASKAKGVISQIQHSEFSTKTRNWFKQNFQKLKEKIDSTFSKEH